MGPPSCPPLPVARLSIAAFLAACALPARSFARSSVRLLARPRARRVRPLACLHAWMSSSMPINPALPFLLPFPSAPPPGPVPGGGVDIAMTMTRITTASRSCTPSLSPCVPFLPPVLSSPDRCLRLATPTLSCSVLSCFTLALGTGGSLLSLPPFPSPILCHISTTPQHSSPAIPIPIPSRSPSPARRLSSLASSRLACPPS